MTCWDGQDPGVLQDGLQLLLVRLTGNCRAFLSNGTGILTARMLHDASCCSFGTDECFRMIRALNFSADRLLVTREEGYG